MRFTFTIFLNDQGRPRVRINQREFLPEPRLFDTLSGYAMGAYLSRHEAHNFKPNSEAEEDRFSVLIEGPVMGVHDSSDGTELRADFSDSPDGENVLRNAFHVCIAKAFPEYALKFKEENGIAILDPNHTPKLP